MLKDVKGFITIQYLSISLHGVLPAALPLFIHLVHSYGSHKAARHVSALRSALHLHASLLRLPSFSHFERDQCLKANLQRHNTLHEPASL